MVGVGLDVKGAGYAVDGAADVVGVGGFFAGEKNEGKKSYSNEVYLSHKGSYRLIQFKNNQKILNSLSKSGIN